MTTSANFHTFHAATSDLFLSIFATSAVESLFAGFNVESLVFEFEQNIEPRRVDVSVECDNLVADYYAGLSGAEFEAALDHASNEIDTFVRTFTYDTVIYRGDLRLRPNFIQHFIPAFAADAKRFSTGDGATLTVRSLLTGVVRATETFKPLAFGGDFDCGLTYDEKMERFAVRSCALDPKSV